MRATTQAPGRGAAGAAGGAQAPALHPPVPPRARTPRLLRQEEGDAETRLSGGMEGKGCTDACLRGRAGERPQVWRDQLRAEGRESQPGGGREHPISITRDCRDGRLTSASSEGALSQQGARPGYKPLRQPLALIPTHGMRLCLPPHPQDEAVYPRHGLRGRAGGTEASGASLRWHGTAACPAWRRCQLHPATP